SGVFMILGIAGIVLFNGPLTPAGDSCYCLIPSPEPAAAQGTSSILLALGVMFFPMGLMKGGLPTFRRAPAAPQMANLPAGKAVAQPQILSGSYFGFGILVLVIGVDAVLVPGYLVYRNAWYELAGILLAAAGGISMFWGLRKPAA
ncbi:MAG: hypothetical protein HY297_02455, partial [Thaumarchaeota archaeon]|nr:hypothetical protein [Nitrososphaerota archaeon]